MTRIALTIEYDGTHYSGWQRQINAISVQETLERAIRELAPDETITITGASRTDAGVHARGQVAHFDTTSRIPPEKWAYALNTRLPDDISVKLSRETALNFHARFCAIGKIYKYQITNAPHDSPAKRLYAAHISAQLNVDAMLMEAQSIVGYHDFAAFAASGSIVKDTRRTIHGVHIVKSGEDDITLWICGNGFLYNMIRIWAGTLIEIGTGYRAPGAITRAIASRSRLDLGITAPARGLTLHGVYYDDIKLQNCWTHIIAH